MKKFLSTLGLLSFGTLMHAQITGCTIAPNGAYPSGVVTPVCNNSNEIVAEWGFTGEYTMVKLTKNVSYEFAAALDNGPAFITISENTANPTILASGSGKVVFKPAEDIVIRFYTHLNSNCGNNDYEFVDRKVKCFLDVRDVYCEPTLDCSDGAVIKNVKFADLVNASDCSTNGFNDFTAKKANVKKGETYNFEAEIGYGWYNQSVSVWIDYNKNFLFEPHEFTYIGTIDQGVLSKDITIPDNIVNGEYRMRVRLATVTQSGATADKACDMNDAYGETEDYTLNVVDYLSTQNHKDSEIKLAPNPVVDILNISTSVKVSEINIVDISGKVVSSVKSKNSIDFKSLPSGIYIVNVTLENQKTLSRKVVKK
ncbi:GEVED domain-containing protein [Soonwooa buanensis]|nr:GEVED domain-containing protein [Soonwooa buanensis]